MDAGTIMFISIAGMGCPRILRIWPSGSATGIRVSEVTASSLSAVPRRLIS